jgi:uncharacterized protein YjbI with pentapeptide repeats
VAEARGRDCRRYLRRAQGLVAPAARVVMVDLASLRLMTRQKTNRVAWGLCAVLAGLVLSGLGLMAVQLKPCVVAKVYSSPNDLGWHVDLQGAVLPRAPLAGANLRKADLRGAKLHGANLSGADLSGSNLAGAELEGANLTGVNLTGARYDRQTRWPAGFGRQQHGMVLVTGRVSSLQGRAAMVASE